MKQIPWWRVNLGKEAAKAAYEAVENGRMTLGERCRAFEDRVAALLEVPHVISTSSGTAALTIALLEAGVGCGDEVVVPDQTWIATAHAPLLLGAKVVLADVEKERRLLDPEAFERVITSRTRAVIPVHLNGKAVQMEAIRIIAAKHGIHVIEDAAQAFTSRSSEGWLGTHSRSGCFSLSMGKFVCSGQGGYVVTRDGNIATRLRLARTHGTQDIYAPVWTMKGGNFRFWDLPASIALTQLDRLEERRKALIHLYQQYYEELSDLERLSVVLFNVADGELPLYVECLSEERDSLMNYLARKGIQCRTKYPALHLAPQFSRHPGETYCNSLRFSRECFVLPCGPDQTEENIERTIYAVKEWHRL